MEIKAVVKEEPKEPSVAVIKRNCYNCGQIFNGNHRRHCPALNVKCHTCSKTGHFSKFCKTSNVKSENVKTTKKEDKSKKVVHKVDWSDEQGTENINIDSVDNAIRIGAISSCNLALHRLRINRIRWNKRYVIQDWPIEFKIDTGSDANCIPIGFVKKIGASIKQFSNEFSCNVIDYSSNQIKICCTRRSSGVGYGFVFA